MSDLANLSDFQTVCVVLIIGILCATEYFTLRDF